MAKVQNWQVYVRKRLDISHLNISEKYNTLCKYLKVIRELTSVPLSRTSSVIKDSKVMK